MSIAALVAVAALALTGCEPTTADPKPTATELTPTETPTATHDPAKPELGELVLTTEGLNELVFGETPPNDDPTSNVAIFDVDACEAEGLPGIWVANYPDIDEGFGPQAPFTIQVLSDALTRIDVASSDIFTDKGIHVGSSLDEVLGVYPGGPDQVVNHADVSDVYVIKGTKGQLQFEVAVDRIPDYWDPAALDTVVFLSAIDIFTEPYGVAATDNAIGQCNAP